VLPCADYNAVGCSGNPHLRADFLIGVRRSLTLENESHAGGAVDGRMLEVHYPSANDDFHRARAKMQYQYCIDIQGI
jgi:hypothetical protein